MKKLESSITNMVVVLVAVAVITGSLLAWVNQVTAGPIKQQDELALANGIKSVMCLDKLEVTANDELTQNIGGKDYQFVIHKVNNDKGEFAGAAVESTTMGFGGELKVLVGFDAAGKILGYAVLQHAETPGLGAKADKWFQSVENGGNSEKSSIIGKNPAKNQLRVTKDNDGGEIDAITASTITSRAFLRAVQEAYNTYAENK